MTGVVNPLATAKTTFSESPDVTDAQEASMSAQIVTQVSWARIRVLVAAHDPGVVPDVIIAAPNVVGKVSARAFLYALLGALGVVRLGLRAWWTRGATRARSTPSVMTSADLLSSAAGVFERLHRAPHGAPCSAQLPGQALPGGVAASPRGRSGRSRGSACWLPRTESGPAGNQTTATERRPSPCTPDAARQNRPELSYPGWRWS